MRAIIGLDGREYTWNVTKRAGGLVDTASRYHVAARRLLHKMYPYVIYEEVPLPGSRQKGRGYNLFLDFYIPNINLAIEVHGKQHYEFVPFFHKTRRAFAQALNRDDDKIEWCEINNIDIVALSYLDSEDDWTEQLKRRTNLR